MTHQKEIILLQIESLKREKIYDYEEEIENIEEKIIHLSLQIKHSYDFASIISMPDFVKIANLSIEKEIQELEEKKELKKVIHEKEIEKILQLEKILEELE